MKAIYMAWYTLTYVCIYIYEETCDWAGNTTITKSGLKSYDFQCIIWVIYIGFRYDILFEYL